MDLPHEPEPDQGGLAYGEAPGCLGFVKLFRLKFLSSVHPSTPSSPSMLARACS